MYDNEIQLQIKIEMLTMEMKKAAEEVSRLVSPLNAVSLYAQYIIEDCEGKDIEDSLERLSGAAKKCIIIVKRLSEITRVYLTV